MAAPEFIAANSVDRRETKPKQQRVTRKTIITLAICFIEALTLGGTYTGWNMLVYTLKKDGVYESACENGTVGNGTTLTGFSYSKGGDLDIIECDARATHMSFAYTIAVFLNGIAAFFMGWFFDRFGLRITHFLGAFFLLVAFFMLGYAGRDVSWLIYPGASFMSVGNIIMMICLNHINNLLRDKASTGVAMYNGAYTTSGMMFFFLKVADDNGFRRPYFMLIMMGISFGAIVTTFTLLPKYKVSPVTGLPITSNVGSTEVLEETPALTLTAAPPVGLSTSNSFFVSDISPSREVQVKKRKNSDSFLSSLTSVLYLTHLYWFAINHLRVHYFVGSFNALVTSVMHEDKVSFFSDVYGFSIILALLVAPSVGIFMDARRRYLDKTALVGPQRSIAAIIPIALACVLMLGLGCTVLLSEDWAMYASILLVQAGRGFIYATCAAYVQIAFPPSHYGKLFGISHALGGIFNLSQYGFFFWASEADNFFPGNLVLLVLTAISFVHPITVFTYHRLTLGKRKEGTKTNIIHITRF